MNDSTVMRALLFDFYGELLTDKQREYFDLHYNDDLSLNEIAEQAGTSRQAVWDNIRRAEASLNDIESRIGLVGRFSETRDTLDGVLRGLDELAGLTDGRAHELCGELKKSIEQIRL